MQSNQVSNITATRPIYSIYYRLLQLYCIPYVWALKLALKILTLAVMNGQKCSHTTTHKWGFSEQNKKIICTLYYLW